ncbi:hypothetical protein DPMN_097269 [Dreissena polymorpha]|uniref:Uncharacterized protein n=1 Tax=Dreissena polymorpha TaxID=45954 RepID=A0A9D4LA03_DREPO|nr:hypothetical protein DPMN_097269 [Dreissena polymorpha]
MIEYETRYSCIERESEMTDDRVRDRIPFLEQAYVRTAGRVRDKIPLYRAGVCKDSWSCMRQKNPV